MRYTKSTIAAAKWLSAYRFQSLADSGEEGWSPLMCAVVEINAEMVGKILAAGAPVNAKVTQAFPDMGIMKGQTALHVAATVSSPEIVQMLVNAKADINVFDDGNVMCPLICTVYMDQSESAEILLANGADVHLSSMFESDTAASAAGFNATKVLEVCCKHGANVNRPNILGNSPLQCSAVFWDNPAIIQKLLDCNADPNFTSRPKPAFQPMADQAAEAADKGSTSKFHHLVGKSSGSNALGLAAFNGAVNATKLLLKARADPSTKRDDGKTAAEVAEFYGHKEVAALIRGAVPAESMGA
eukprot:gnl/TRDRNA2_/TRDRNA2_121697_c1_seq1.p1 gnl/TRDRNA2_/TRDRNA2_121697_c1~~gnl/TRDRNA2_/TRDRNA2_121697_c1_seq1.p1  ORF type:complete len:300 (+),score=47.16 gnl/TRDRNA2_/TRDRNA2_121697_c1_seq1:2-901(+)